MSFHFAEHEGTRRSHCLLSRPQIPDKFINKLVCSVRRISELDYLDILFTIKIYSYSKRSEAFIQYQKHTLQLWCLI